MLLYDLLAHGLKRSEADLQRDLGSFDSALANAVEDLGRKVQARGRSSDRTAWLGVNGLILLAIGRRVGAVDVRRQRDVPNSFQHAEDIVNQMDTQMALAERSNREQYQAINAKPRGS